MSESGRPNRSTAGPHCWWQGWCPDPSGSSRLLVVASDAHPDGTRVTLDADDASAVDPDVICTVDLRDGIVVALRVAPWFVPGAPDVWFVELAEPDLDRPATNLLAFTGLGRVDGELLDEDTAEPLPIQSADQLGAIRWWPDSGEFDQVYVQPAWRRRHLGSLLVTAAAALAVARDKPRLWGDGQRTALGEHLRNARSWASRTADLTHLAPPMTPAGAGEG